MRFRLPHEPIEFEIPDGWLRAARFESFESRGTAFLASNDPEFPTRLVPLTDVKAPVRSGDVPWFDADRMVSILRAIVIEQALPVLKVDIPPEPMGFRFRVREGFHRYYASAAVGYRDLPVAVIPYD